jgi:hypothetical protein
LAEYGDGSNGYGNYGELFANFANTTYNYNLMPDELTSSSTAAERRAVAQLIYHCGVAVNMAYGPGASGAYTYQSDYWIDRSDGVNTYIDARTAFKRYFGYTHAEAIKKENCADEAEWIEILKEQLSNRQPVLYSGRTTNDEGHAFVCDGYDANDFFHINWGWGGMSNCYTTVSSLLPDEQGTGGGSGGFSENQVIIINIKAIKDEKTLGWVKSSDYADLHNTIDTEIVTLLPDTCLKSYTNSGNWNATNLHAMGITFDPYSKSFGSYHSDSLFNKSYTYRLDTLQITSVYTLGKNGYNPAHPDTLRIYLSYYEPYSGEPSNGDYRIMSSGAYPYLLPNVVKTEGNLQKGDRIRPVATNTVVINYVLTKEDTAETDVNNPGSFTYKHIKIPVTYKNATINGFEVPAGAVTGAMVKFIPGYDYNLNDTLYYGLVANDEWEYGYPVYINNSFGMAYSLGSHNDFADHKGYNGTNLEVQSLRYQQNHSYQDSCYAYSRNYLPWMAFHITCDISPTYARLEIDTAVCKEEYIYNGITYKENGTYKHRYYTSKGDSIVVINLHFYDPVGTIGTIQGDTFITQTGTYTYTIAPVENAVSYQWEVSNASWNISGSSTLTTLTLDINSASVGTLSVKAIDACGDYVQASITIQSNVSVLEYENENAIQIYPNPAKDVVFLLINNALIDGEIHLFDIFGRVLDRQKITDRQMEINMSSFSGGVYVIQIKENNGSVKSFKIVKTE